MFQLPELDIGDWLYYEDIGDYTAAVASSTSLMASPNHCHTIGVAQIREGLCCTNSFKNTIIMYVG